jgi:hypothetical protein
MLHNDPTWPPILETHRTTVEVKRPDPRYGRVQPRAIFGLFSIYVTLRHTGLKQ